MKVKFLSSKKQELKKLSDLFLDYQWFIDNDFPIVLPKFYKELYLNTKHNKKVFQKELNRELNKIYDKNVYTRKRKIITSRWQKVENDFFNILSNLGFKTKNNYLCHISLYGPEGQFQYPNIIDMRIAKKSDIEEANITIAHEIIHLVIFNKVKKLRYEQIEGVVDLFFTETELKNLFPNYVLQNIALHDKKLFKKIIKI